MIVFSPFSNIVLVQYNEGAQGADPLLQLKIHV